MTLTVDVVGTPAPQGSKRSFQHRSTGRVVTVESGHKKVHSWRHDVQAAAADAVIQTRTKATALQPVSFPLHGPLAVVVEFYLPRPGYHYRTGKHAHELKPNAPSHVDKKPDVDKLLRSTLDGLKESGVYRDDAQVADARGVKRYADAATGARITITPLLDEPATPAPPPRPAVDREEALFL